MKRYYIIVEGQVQGVGFRNFTQLIALRNNCTGWVRNMDNGMVEIHLQGEESNIRNVIATLKAGNLFIRIDNLSEKEIPIVLFENNFQSKY